MEPQAVNLKMGTASGAKQSPSGTTKTSKRGSLTDTEAAHTASRKRQRSAAQPAQDENTVPIDLVIESAKTIRGFVKHFYPAELGVVSHTCLHTALANEPDCGPWHISEVRT